MCIAGFTLATLSQMDIVKAKDQDKTSFLAVVIWQLAAKQQQQLLPGLTPSILTLHEQLAPVRRAVRIEVWLRYMQYQTCACTTTMFTCVST